MKVLAMSREVLEEQERMMETLDEAIEETHLHPKTEQTLRSALSTIQREVRQQSESPHLKDPTTLVHALNDIKQVIDAAARDSPEDEPEFAYIPEQE